MERPLVYLEKKREVRRRNASSPPGRRRDSCLGHLRIEGGLLLAGVLLLSLCAYFLATMDQRVRATEKIEKKDYSQDYYRFADVMAEIFVQIEDKYVEPVDTKKLFKGALDGMFDALDPHSGYLDSDNFKELEKSTEGEFSGIGIHINEQDGVLTVVSPIPGTPAARAGMRSWDRIIEIEGKSTEGMTVHDAVRTLTGPIGTKVNLVVYRESERRHIPMTIIRDRIKIESVYSNVDAADYVTPYFKYLLKTKIGYARLSKFSEQISEDLTKVLNKMKDAGVEGLVLDLRFNSGGLLDQAIAVSNLFLDKDKVIVATKGRLPDQNNVYKARNPKLVDWPMVVLVNRASASASEIVAGALKDHHRAVLLGAMGPKGANTFGKGSVQTISPLRVSLDKDKEGNDLPNAIRLTTAKYYTPSNAGPEGKSIHGIGVEPDVTIDVEPKQEEDLLTKGLMLGDPALFKPEEKKKDEGQPDSEEKAKTPGPEATPTATMETKDKGTNEDENGKAREKDDWDEESPFYLKEKQKNAVPQTQDLQLKYGVDLLRALLIARSER